MRAVLLAAGEGKRLRPYFDRPKPLVRLLGLPLVERNILALRQCGVREFVIITGRYDSEIRDSLGNGEKHGISIEYLHCPDWQKGNGLSAYAFHGKWRRDEKFLLLMADHVFETGLLADFIAGAGEMEPGDLLLAADCRLEKVFDLDECTKVQCRGNHAVKLGKGLDDFQAVDCGLFAGTGSLLWALSETIKRGAYSLTDAVNLLAEGGRVKLHFVKNSWIDVDDLASYKEAEKILLKSLVPPKDGFISRVFNRRFSLGITRLLSATPITPNQVTFLSFLVTAAAAAFFATARPLIGGMLTQLASVLDGVDGEIARLKFLKSSFGEILDSMLDRYGDCLVAAGMTCAWYSSTGSPMALLAGAAALAGMPMSMLFKEKFRNVSGQPFIPELHDGFLRYLPANRDGRLFIVMLGGILNMVPAALVLLAAVTHLQSLARLFGARKILD